MFKINEKTRESILKYTGKTVDEIYKLDDEELIEAIQEKIKTKLVYPKILDKRLTGRGSIFLFLNRFVNMDKVEERLSEIGR